MLDVVLIGAGSIAGNKEVDNKQSKITTHAHAIYNHEKLNLLGVVDVDYEKAIKVAEKWDTKAYSYLSELNNKKVDIFVIASTTSSHYMVLNEIFRTFNPLIVICEKPFCDKLSLANDIHKIYYNDLIPIAINYTRRYSSFLQNLRNDLYFGNYGEIYSCISGYNRGLYRDGCHAIDLFNWFFGKFKDGRILGNEINTILDLNEEDPTVPVWLSYEKCKNVFMSPVDGRKSACFEFTIYTEKGKIVLSDWFQNCKFYPVYQEKTYGSYMSLSGEKLIDVEIQLTNCLSDMYNNVISYIEDSKELLCTAIDGIAVHKVIEYLRRKR